MEEALLEICANTYTATDIHRRLSLLQECVEEVVYHAHAKGILKEEALAFAKTIMSPLDVQAFSEWGDSVWGLFSPHAVAEVIQALKAQSEMLPMLKLYVPVLFEPEKVASLGQWAREQIAPHILLEMHIDPAVTGGCAFVFNDTYHDYSLHRAFAAHKGVVRELLNTYA